MITRMTVRNFKALRDVTVDLAPFTVLIGPNDTGKTSFLEAVYAISESTRNPLAECFWSPWQDRELVHNQVPEALVGLNVNLVDQQQTTEKTIKDLVKHLQDKGTGTDRIEKIEQHFPANSDSDASAALQYAVDCDMQQGTIEKIGSFLGCPIPQKSLDYAINLKFSQGRNCSVVLETLGIGMMELESVGAKSESKKTAVCKRLPHLRRVADSLHKVALARFDPEELAMPSWLPVERRYPFDPTGYGLSAYLAELKLGNLDRFNALQDDFCRMFPAFYALNFRRADVSGFARDENFQKTAATQGNGYALYLRRDGMEIPAALASGGSLFALAYLTLRHLPEPRKLLLIEEPENGLHPSRLQEVADVLRQFVKSQEDCQVIVTTHSPLLLDFVDPAEVRVFLRDDRDDITVHNVADVPDIRERLKYLMLGELVYNEGEKELVKEIRQHANTHSR